MTTIKTTRRDGVTALIATGLVVMLAGSAGAEQAGRYVLQRAGDGFIRLDTQTGATAHCSLREKTWRCDSLDGALAVHQELQRLAQENRRLKARIAALEAGKSARAPKTDLPSEEEFSRIMDFMEMAMKRFLEFARTLRDAPGKEI